jgi:hypothetical protein
MDGGVTSISLFSKGKVTVNEAPESAPVGPRVRINGNPPFEALVFENRKGIATLVGGRLFPAILKLVLPSFVCPGLRELPPSAPTTKRPSARSYFCQPSPIDPQSGALTKTIAPLGKLERLTRLAIQLNVVLLVTNPTTAVPAAPARAARKIYRSVLSAAKSPGGFASGFGRSGSCVPDIQSPQRKPHPVGGFVACSGLAATPPRNISGRGRTTNFLGLARFSRCMKLVHNRPANGKSLDEKLTDEIKGLWVP